MSEIDVKTLRDGDKVRATNGAAAVEGFWQGGCLFSDEARSDEVLLDTRFRGWTITDVLRPVLVKGDRVEWRVLPAGPYPTGVVACVYPDEVYVDFGSGIPTPRISNSELTRLPAPEPAPIEVGSWWRASDGTPHVVIAVGDNIAEVRAWDESEVRQQAIRGMRLLWTPLDGPPEPPAGSVYDIAGRVWHHRNIGHTPAILLASERSWEKVCAHSTREGLATLHVLRVGA